MPQVKGEDGSGASPVNDLLDTRGALSSAIHVPSKAITEVAQKVTQTVAGGKRSPHKYRPALPSEIGKYCQSAWCTALFKEQVDTFNLFQCAHLLPVCSTMKRK